MTQILLWALVVLVITILFIVDLLYKHVRLLKETIPQEILNLKEQFSPLIYLPFRWEATHLTHIKTEAEKKSLVLLKRFYREEFLEMERFSLSGSATEAFVASDSLKGILRKCAAALAELGQVNKWEEEYTQMLVDVMSGKVTIEEAKKSLSFFDYASMVIDMDEAHINKMYASLAENWQTDRWLDTLESHRKVHQ